jgi:simple sugar transport system substrate-binding protein
MGEEKKDNPSFLSSLPTRKLQGGIMKRTKSLLALFLAALLIISFGSCKEEGQQQDAAGQTEEKSASGEQSGEEVFEIAVFVPGVVSGSPLYEMLVAGTQKAAEEYEHVTVKVIEGGFAQSEWEEKVTTITATGKYDLIVTSNPAMPEICAQVGEEFPEQRYLVLDGHLEGDPQIYTFLYNQMEQAYLIGHLGGLVTTSSMPGANEELRVGLIAGQEYPIMNQVIRPGFELGINAAAQGAVLDMRILGNWYDATKAGELAYSMFEQGVDVILTIAGSANEGVVSAAKEQNKYVLWFDSNGYSVAPGTVVGSSAIRQDKAAYETVKEAIEGSLPFGTAEIAGIKEGYIIFIEDDERYINNVPEKIREKQREVIEKLKDEEITLPMPTL